MIQAKLSFLVLIYSVLSVVTAQVADEVQKSKNLALNFLPKQVILQDINSANNDNVCSKVWEIEGTVCSGKSLLRYQRQETKDISSQCDKTLASLSLLQRTIGKVEQLGILKSSRTLLFGSSTRQSGISVERRLQYLRLLNSSLSELRIFKDKRFLNQFKFRMDSCWVKLQRARNASLCHTCSKSNSQYYFNGKAIVSQDDCSDIVKSCAFFFKSAVNIIESAKNFFENEKTIKTTDIYKIQIENLDKELVRSNLKSLLNNFSMQVNDTTQMQQVSDEICARVFQLHTDPLFETVKTVLKEVEEEVKATISVVDGTSTKGSEPPRIPNHFFSLPDNNPFTSDIVVFRQADNIFVSFDGNLGTKIHANSGSVRPMNLTLDFP